MGNFIFDLQRFADDVTINAGETYAADGVTYKAITDAQLNVDDDAVTGIASGSVAATVTGADTSPTVTFDASDGAIDFTASSDGITITVTKIIPMDFVSGEFAYKGNTLTAGANSVAAFSVQLDNYIFSDEDTFESGGTYTFSDTGFVLDSDHITSLYTLTNGTDVRRIQVDSYGKVSSNFDDIGFTLHAGSNEVLTIGNYTLTATAIEDSVINFDLTEDGIMLIPNSDDSAVNISLKRGDLEVFGGELNVTSGSITFGYDNAVTFAAGTSFTLEQYGYTFSATTTDKATTAVELTDTGISFTPGENDGGLQVLLSKGDTPIFGGVLNVTGGTISFNPTTQKFSFTEGTNIALTLLNDTSRKFDIKVVDAAAAFKVEADTSGNLTITPDSGDGSLEVTYTLEGDTPISQTVKVSLDGSIVFNPATQSLTLTEGTTASVDLNNYTVTATATDDASVSISMTDAGFVITPQDGDGKLDISIASGDKTIFSNTIGISGGSIVFNPATQALTLTDGTTVSVVMNDYLALSATANGDATSAISFTDGGISVTPNQGDGALDITLSTPVGSLPAGIEVLSGSFTLGQGGAITVAKDTEIQVSFFDEYIVNFKTTDDASVSIGMTEAGFAITPQDGDGSLDVSITRGNALIFRNNISISNGSVVWNPVAQTMTLTDGTSVSVVMNDKYTLTMTADGDAASKVVLTDGGISVTPNQGDGTLDMSLSTPDGTLSAGIEVLNGSFTIKPGGAITVAKDTELKLDFGDGNIVGFKATDEAGGTIFLGAEGLTFTPGSDDGGLELSVTRGDTTRSASLDVTGTVTYKLDGSISLAQGTVVKNVFESGNILTITANTDADGAIAFTPENGLTITPKTPDALNIALTRGDVTIGDITSITGTINYNGGVITASNGSALDVSYYNGEYDIHIETTGGSSVIQFDGDRVVGTAGDGANLVLTYPNNVTWEIKSNSTLTKIFKAEAILSEGANFSSNDTSTVFTLEKAGTYTLNGKTVTTADDAVEVKLANYDTIISDGIGYSSTDENLVLKLSNSGATFTGGTANVSLIQGMNLDLTVDASDGEFSFDKTTGEISVAQGTKLSLQRGALTVDAVAKEDFSTAVEKLDDKFTFTTDNAAFDITLTRDDTTVREGELNFSGTFGIDPATQKISVTKGTTTTLTVGENSVELTANDDAGFNLSDDDGKISLTFDEGDGSLAITAKNGDAVIFANDTNIVGTITIDPLTRELFIAKDTVITMNHGDKVLEVTALDDAGGQLSFVGDGGLRFAPNDGDGKLDLNFVGTGRKATIDVSGAVVLGTDATIALEEGTVADIEWESGTQLKVSASADGGSIGLDNDKLKISGNGELSIDFSTTAGVQTKMSNLVGTIYYDAGKVTFDEDSKITATSTLGGQPINITLESNGVGGYLDISANGTNYVAGTGALKITWSRDDKESSFAVNSGSVYIGHGIFEITEGTDLSTDLKDLVPALNFTTSKAGEYTINGQTITTSAANMAMTATDDRMTFKPESDLVEYDGMLFTGDGNVSLTQDGVILGAGIEATGFGLSNSFILNEEGNVTVDSRIFELTEDVPTGITVTGAQDGFIFSRTNTEESEARMDDPDSANVGKIFTEEFFLSNDDSYSVQTDLLGLQKIIGVTAPATVNATATFGGESTRTIFDLVTETEGVFTVGDKPYTIGGDSSVGIKTAFDTTATGVRGFDDLLGTVNGDFTEFPISINGGKSIIIAGDSSIDLVATESGIELYNVSGGASLIEVAGVSKVHTDSEGTFTFGNGQDDTIAITILDDDSVTFGLNDGQYVTNIDDIEGNIIFSETSNHLSVNGMSGTFDGEFSSLAASSSIIFIHDIQDGSSFKTADDEDKFWLQLLGGSFAFNDNNLTLTNDNNGVWIRGKNVLGLETNASLQVSEAGTYVVNFFSTLEAQAGDIIVGTANSGARIYDEHYIENISSDTLVTGTADADTIINSGTAVTIQALDGDDFISNEVDSSVTAAEFGNSINAGDGNDTIYNYHTYNPTLLGGAGDDSIVVSSGHQTFADGGDGDDTIRGVQVSVSSGNGWYMGGYATIDGGAGDDLIDTGYSNNSSINGGDGDDTIVTNGASATVDGGDGNNLIQLTTIEGGATGQYVVFSGNTTVEGFGTGFGEGTDTVYIAGDAPGCDFWTDGLALYNSTATLTFADVTTTTQLNIYYPNEDKMATEVLIADDEWYSVADGAASYYVGATAKLTHGINFNGISDALDVTLNTDYESTVASFWVNNVHSIIGGAGATTITGSTLSDTIIAGDGATTINAGAGGDKLFGNGKTVFNVDKGATTTINGSAGDTINVGDDNYTFETDGTVYIAGGSLASYSRQTVLKSGDEYLTGNDNLAYVNGNSVTLTADDTELIVGKRGGTISGYDFNKTTYITSAASFADLVQSIRTDQFEFDAGTFHAVGQRDVVLEGVDTSKGTFLTFQSKDEVKGLFGWSGKLDGVVDGSDIDKSQILLSASKGGTITLRGGSKGDTIYSGEGDVVSVSGGHDYVSTFKNDGGDVTFDLGDGSTNGIMEVVDELGLAAYVVKVDDTDDLNLRMVDDRLTFRKGNSRVVFDEATSFADANGLQVQVGDEVYTVRSDYSGGMSGVDYFWAGEGDLYYKPDTSLYLHDDGQTREYHITEGSGRATIDGFNHGVYGDTVFIDEIDNMRQVGDDVAIVSGDGDRVLIKDGANKIYNMVYDGSHYVAAIGSSLTYNAWVDVYGGGTGGNTVSVGADYSGNEVAVYMNGAAEVGGKEKYYFGVDKIDAAAYGGRASLIGGELNDTIIAAQGATSLWGGDSGNDVLHGTGTGNEFFYFRGNGRDVIRNAADGDVVNLYDVTLDDISATAINNAQASIEFKDGGSVTFDSAADATFKLGDGSTWKANHQSNEWQSQEQA